MTVLSLDALLNLRMVWRQAEKRVVLTNGVFDLLHAGHVAYLEQARTLGNILIIGVNSDESTRTIKGPLRPLVPAAERAHILAALRCVDYVTIFEQPTAEALVLALKPDVYVKGGDYAVDRSPQTIDEQRLPEAKVVRGYDGDVVLLPFAEGRSTSELIARIVQRYGKSDCP
ncbi:MAG: adenylyltransferase/cytidyltransferase family protein [Chloroflexales bacterium]|nr:adenylyltransferase/cytidyltransferase family protein [Chloroflexales bacterium]